MKADHLNSKNKVASALAMMTEILTHQRPVKCPSVPSWMQPVARFSRDSSCGEHECCVSFRETLWKAVSGAHPDCIAREFLDNGEKYFVVYAEFNPLSRRLGRGNNECIAWENALKEISPNDNSAQRTSALSDRHFSSE